MEQNQWRITTDLEVDVSLDQKKQFAPVVLCQAPRSLIGYHHQMLLQPFSILRYLFLQHPAVKKLL